MKTKWKTAMAAAVLSLTLVASAIPVMADDAVPSASISTLSYALNDSITASVKRVAVNRTTGGLQIGAVVRLTNNGNGMLRVPDYEIRVKTKEGIEYKLQPSASNMKSIMAKENGELSYMVTVDRPDDIEVTDLSFVEVDEYTYPKTEKVLLSVPVALNVWYGTKGQLTDPYANMAWGQPFQIPGSSSPIRYTPVELTKQNDANGFSYLVTLMAENPGTGNETVSNFRMDGKTPDKLYIGKKVEQEPVTLAPGEKKYVHFAITSDKDINLIGLMLMTTEGFVPAGGQAGQGAGTAGAGSGTGASAGTAAGPVTTSATGSGFDVGRLVIAAPTQEQMNNTANYTMGTPIALDPMNHLIDSKTEVSLVELHLHDNDGQGFKSVVAKFKVSNKGDMTVAFPQFQAQLVGGDGASYAGTRQTTTAAEIMPNLGYVVSYSFMIPASEKGDNLTMKLLDNQTAAPYSSTIANFSAPVQKEADDSVMSLYPFNAKLDNWTIQAYTNPGGNGLGLSYSYNLKLWLTIDRLEDVVVDQNFSKMKFEIVDSAGRILGSQTASLTGENKLVSGEQMIQFSNIKTDQFSYPLTLHIYEAIDTPNGEATRLVKSVTQ